MGLRHRYRYVIDFKFRSLKLEESPNQKKEKLYKCGKTTKSDKLLPARDDDSSDYSSLSHRVFDESF